MIIEASWRGSARRRHSTSMVIAVLLMAAWRAAAAQPDASSATGTVTGVVTVLGSTRPVPEATVTLDDARHGAASDSLGQYRIAGVPPGEHMLTVRRIGFEAVTARIMVEVSAEAGVDVELNPSAPAQLAEVLVVAAPSPTGRLAGMEHRRSTNAGGTFITTAQLDSGEGRPLATLLAKKLPGAVLTTYNKTGGTLLSSSRSRMSGRALPLADPMDERSPRACYAQVYLDGMRIYSIANTGMAVPDLRDFRVETLAAVEYYAGNAQTPSEFAGEGAACGTIVFWTR
jgi:hypothetical protein